MNYKNDLLAIIDDSFGIEKKHILEASKELRKIKERSGSFRVIDRQSVNKVIKNVEEERKRLKLFRLFGTSGIRGIFDNKCIDPVYAYAEKNFMSSKLAYYYGRAYGWLILELRMKTEVRLSMDPRPSGILMAVAICEGLQEEGIDVFFNGVASTPMGSLYSNSIIITASHNEIKFNGIKAFINGIPITFEIERTVETGFRVLARFDKRKRAVPVNKKRGKVFNSVEETRNKYLEMGRKMIVEEGLGKKNEIREITGDALKKTVMPLDLAFGAAGANILNDNSPKTISPQIKLLLEVGITIVGYGTERDGGRTNYRVGAAYPYGETPDAISDGELSAFARGDYGYGDDKNGGHISRTFYFPKDHLFENPSLKEKALELTDAYIFLDVDNPSNKNLLVDILEEIKNFELLPGCSVDCDADRFLATSPHLSKQTIPYLSGDLMIMVFAANLKESIKKVVFTVESGLSIVKFLEKMGVGYKEVTVGDRAIADYIMDEERLKNEKYEDRHKIIGGEPSGHMMFGAKERGKMFLIDDPVITHLKLLGLMRARGKSFDELIGEVSEEVFTARKPEAWAGEQGGVGLSLLEKDQLEFKRRSNRQVHVTRYARMFIQEYISIFSKGYIEAYYNNIPVNYEKFPEAQNKFKYTEEYKELLNEGDLHYRPVNYLHLGDIFILTRNGGLIEEIEIRLRIAEVDWAGPFDINLSFYSYDKDSKPCLAGAVVTRNSGTSPKNSAYNKLWFEHYPTGSRVSNDVIKKVTSQMAESRVEVTNWYVEELRNVEIANKRGIY